MAKPWWAGFFAQHSQSVLELALDSLSFGDGERPLAGHQIRYLLSPAPAAGESPIRAEAAQILTVAYDRPLAVIAIPALSQGDIQFSIDQNAPGVAAATPAVDSIVSGDVERSGMVMFGGGQMPFGQPGLPFANYAEPQSNYVVLYAEDFQSGLVVNTLSKTLMQGGPGDWPELGRGPNDTLELSGDFTSGFTLPSQPADIDTVIGRDGGDYNLVVNDDHVGPGETLTINAMPVGPGGHMIFDGSAETDGNFVFFGSQQGDTFLGGAGDDRIVGLGGGDTLSGGGGSDTFVYTGAGESSGANYDMLADFTAGTDHIDLLGTVTGFAGPIAGGSLSTASFDSDLGAAVGALGASQAVWFAPDAGDLAGTIFLIVDANGVAGYQPGEDYVFAVGGTPLADLTGHTDIFV